MTASADGISRFANKTVEFRFKGRALAFRLSHGLFSSFDIDSGSRLLLKSLASQVDFAHLRSALDIGCGVGVIGACIAAQAPGAKVVLQDRDALAVAFARENCSANGLDGVSVACCLAFHGLGEEVFDLVVSNLPAKAGTPVLRALLRSAAGTLASGGTAAVVVVQPLADFVRESLAGFGCPVVYREESSSHAVFHYRAGAVARETALQREDLAPYIRSSSRFSAEGFDYELKTAYSLSDFDVIGYAVEAALGVAREIPARGHLLAWNPGQGHLPAAILSRDAAKISSVAIAGRDILQTTITAINIASAGKAPARVQAVCCEADLAAAFPAGSFDLVLAAPHPIPRVPWQADLADASAGLLKTGGGLLVVCSSTEIRRLLDRHAGFKLEGSRKHMGFRAVMLRKI